MSANPDEGEVEFTSRGKTWKLSYTNRTLRSLEKKTGLKTRQLLSTMQEGADIDVLIQVFHAGLSKYHAEVSEDDAMDLVSPGKLVQLVSAGFQAAFGSEEEKGSSDDPPQSPGQQT